ncbi:hypothetical protein, partial [Bacteroides sp.]|uniref:hypothetical protein n=1 Tax=Bacteroides sp. TaxID=29523 RepID=UPI002A7F801F
LYTITHLFDSWNVSFILLLFCGHGIRGQVFCPRMMVVFNMFPMRNNIRRILFMFLSDKMKNITV